MHTYYIDAGTRTLTHTGTPESAVHAASKLVYISPQTQYRLRGDLTAHGRAAASYAFTCIEIHRR
jgi:hypothetical protein